MTEFKALRERRLRMKKKLVLALVALSLALSLAACGKKKDKEAKNQTEYEDTEDSVSGELKRDSEEEYEEEIEDYTLEDIAALNDMSVEQLNVLWGYNDGIVFLGDRYSDDIVTNEEEALASLSHIKTLANLDGVELEYNRTDVSPVTGNVVYTFYQTAKTMLDGEEITAKFYNSLIKVITDRDGNLVGVSADIIPAYEMETVETDEIITKGEAIEYVKSLINDDRRRVYEDVSEYAFWDDQGTVVEAGGESKISPAWFIYADAEPDNNVSKPYEVYVVSLTPEYDFDEDDEIYGTPAVLASYYVETLDVNDTLDVYTSTFYFDGMKDAGTYTYEVNLDWVKKYYKDYKGPSKASYTVPVMYSEREDLYYLGNLNKKITLSNFYDFDILGATNAYVTKTPENKDSWHFQLDRADDGSTGKYFDNPNYVLSSFSVMCDVWEDFYERYGLDSVDGTGLPTMLCVYAIDGYEYPEKESDFMYNAVNMGQNRDWQVMATSIVMPLCLEHEVMAHEYTHGINGQLTMSQYFNGAGAVMESYADIIGEQISILNGYPECSDEHEWHLGGVIGDYLRNMSDPYEFFSPKYIGGNYYINPVSDAVSSVFDEGGVHTNSSILNYLAYCMVNGTGEGNEATLTMDECLDIWFDTLYYTNHQTDYYDVATYLTLAAESTDIDEDKYYYLRQLLVDFGLVPDDEGEAYVSYEEDTDYYSINVTYDDSQYDDLEEVFKFGFDLIDDNDNEYLVGGLYDNGSVVYGVTPDKNIIATVFWLGNKMSGEMEFYYLDELEAIPHEMDILFTAEKAGVEECLTTDPGFEMTYAKSTDGMDFNVEDNEDGTSSLYFENEGTVVVILKNLNESDENYGKYTVFYIECEE